MKTREDDRKYNEILKSYPDLCPTDIHICFVVRDGAGQRRWILWTALASASCAVNEGQCYLPLFLFHDFCHLLDEFYVSIESRDPIITILLFDDLEVQALASLERIC